MLLARWMLAASLASVAALALTVVTLAAAHPQIPPAVARPDPAAARPEAPADRPDPAAEEIRSRMEKAYAEAKTYQDEGESVTVFNESGNLRTVRKPFQTRFARPRLFRFQYTDRAARGGVAPNLYVIWSDAAPGRAKAWWTLQPEVKETDLAMALGTAVGVSSNTSTTIPCLLLPEALNRSPLMWLKGLKLVGEEPVEGAACHKIECRNFVGEPETIWIDRETHLLRKMLVATQFPGFSTEETTTYRPRVDAEIPADQFGFEPAKP